MNKELDYNNHIYLTNLRFQTKDKIYLSNYFEIILRNLKITEIKCFSQHFSKKYKHLLSKYTLEEIFEKCQIIKNGYDTYSFIEKNLGNFTMDDFISLYDFKNIIDEYNYENREDGYVTKIEDFEFDNMQKYYYKYFEKFIAVDFESNNNLVNLLKKYNNSKKNDEDLIMNFRKQFISFYNYINNASIEYDIYIFDSSFEIFDGGFKKNPTHFLLKISNEKFNRINNKRIIDKFIQKNEDNFYYFMFILEVFQKIETVSNKRTIIDFLTMIEMFIAHSPSVNRFNVEDSISKQFTEKLLACLVFSKFIKNKNDLLEIKKELSYIYNYRSKLLHGEYFEMKKQLEKFWDLSFYKKKCNMDIDKDYYSSDGLIEKYISIRIKIIFKIIFKLKVKNNLFIEALK